MEQMLKNCLKLQEVLWDRQGLSQCHACSVWLFRSGGRGKGSACAAAPVPRWAWRARASHSQGHDSDSTQLSFPELFLAALKREVSPATGTAGNGAAERIAGQWETPTLAPLSELGGRPCLLLLNPRFFSLGEKWGWNEINSLLIFL